MQNWADSMKLCQETVHEPFLTTSSVSTRTLLNMQGVTTRITLHFYPALANFSNWTVRNQKPKQNSLISFSASPPKHYRIYSTKSYQQKEEAEQTAFFPGIDEAEVRAESAAPTLLCVSHTSPCSPSSWKNWPPLQLFFFYAMLKINAIFFCTTLELDAIAYVYVF